MKRLLVFLLIIQSFISIGQQHIFLGIQGDLGYFQRSFERNREILKGKGPGRVLNFGLSGSYRVFDKLTIEAGARLNGYKWQVQDVNFATQNEGYEALQQSTTRFMSFYSSLKYSQALHHKKYLFFRLGYESSLIGQSTIVERRNFVLGTDVIQSTINYGTNSTAFVPEIGYEYFNDAGNLISIGLKYHFKSAGDDLMDWDYFSDNGDTDNRIIENDNINISGSYVALTVQFNGLLSYKTKKERVKKKKKEEEIEEPVLVEEPEDTVIEAPDTTTSPVDVDDKSANDRDYTVTHKVKVSSKTVKILIWDHQIEDGDRINLILNGEWILQNYTLTNEKLELEVELEEGANEFILYALNLGEYKPNTAAIIIDDGTKKKKVVLESDLDESGAIEINYKPE